MSTRPSQSRSSTLVRVSCAIVPDCPLATTTSLTRTESLSASWIPAKTLVSEVCAAKPAMMEINPADASRPAPSVRTEGKVIKIATTPIEINTATTRRRSSETWVSTRRRSTGPRSFLLSFLRIWSSTAPTALIASQTMATIMAIWSTWSSPSTHPSRRLAIWSETTRAARMPTIRRTGLRAFSANWAIPGNRVSRRLLSQRSTSNPR